MKVLFIGGNGNISWWCVQRALEKGYEVYELNRGQTRKTRRALQNDVHEIIADIRDENAIKQALGSMEFDVVCDFICFNEEQAKQAIRVFAGRMSQYIVISSESVYRRNTEFIPFREDAPQYSLEINDNYICGKEMVEKTFLSAYKEKGFPVTIIRPGFTYDTILQVPIGQNCFTAPARLKEGYPFLVPGDGENLWAPLHSRDFSDAFIEIVGNKETIGEDYHIAGHRLITLNEMAESIMEALELPGDRLIHIPYDEAIKITDFYGPTITHQHMWHYIYNLDKIRTVARDWSQKVPFHVGISETVQWLMEDPVRRRINPNFDKLIMQVYHKYYKKKEAL